MTGAVDEERVARAYLLRVAEPPAPSLVRFVEENGPVLAAALVRAERCPARVRDETVARKDQALAEHDLAEASRLGARLVIPEDDEWPAWPLLSLEQASARGLTGVSPPLGLWVRGDERLDEAADRAVSIVGARAATSYGEHVASEFAYELAGRGVPIFSGAAYGIDGAAHRGALAADGTTVAVLGCGLDVGYPAGHVALLERIAERGLVLTEYPPGTPPARHRFLVRNRLIAALTEGTVVVEAGARSGARNTACTAGALGKVVMAVPGPIGSAMSVGCHQLIRDASATLVASVADVAETVGRFGDGGAAGDEGPPKPRRPTDGLAKDALRVHEALGLRKGKSAEQVATESGIEVSKVRAILPALEIDELAERCDTGWRRRKEAR
ncbi:DNA-processing protein DprA [Amycolatopsis sp. CA-230715]|uniref:DNA-processing protein DprA n=1 Tax=Amycolatopsis sp. CA-230715 TaxID=2745196 RepID=UPI001C02DF92|nr:DNA-processing protein DprA [Amycolatopsis sp. CA-230715]QWF82952.1 Putative DNA processing protein DprA [Amycolatopsis sp. CA-230715]